MPPTWNALKALIISAAFSAEQLDRICQQALGVSLSGISQSTDTTAQIDAIISYALRYDLGRELADSVLAASAGRPAVQNLLLGDDDMQSEERGPHVGMAEFFRLENRVGRLEDKVDTLLQKTPLNWAIIGWGIMMAVTAGAIVWAIAAVN